jgi:hypothetical protein
MDPNIFSASPVNFTELIKQFYYQCAPYLLPEESEENTIQTWFVPPPSLSELTATPTILQHTQREQHKTTETSVEDKQESGEEEDEDIPYELVLTEEATRLFARGEERRRQSAISCFLFLSGLLRV